MAFLHDGLGSWLRVAIHVQHAPGNPSTGVESIERTCHNYTISISYNLTNCQQARVVHIAYHHDREENNPASSTKEEKKELNTKRLTLLSHSHLSHSHLHGRPTLQQINRKRTHHVNLATLLALLSHSHLSHSHLHGRPTLVHCSK